MTRRRISLVALLALVALTAGVASAHASCLRQSPAELRRQALVIFDGVALDGVTSTGVQRFSVTRYRKGTGPLIVRVRTGWRRTADGSLSVMSEGITPRKRERWRIFVSATSAGVAQTSLCSGSHRL